MVMALLSLGVMLGGDDSLISGHKKAKPREGLRLLGDEGRSAETSGLRREAGGTRPSPCAYGWYLDAALPHGMRGPCPRRGRPPCGLWRVTFLCVAKEQKSHPSSGHPPPIRSPLSSSLASATAPMARADGPSLARRRSLYIPVCGFVSANQTAFGHLGHPPFCCGLKISELPDRVA